MRYCLKNYWSHVHAWVFSEMWPLSLTRPWGAADGSWSRPPIGNQPLHTCFLLWLNMLQAQGQGRAWLSFLVIFPGDVASLTNSDADTLEQPSVLASRIIWYCFDLDLLRLWASNNPGTLEMLRKMKLKRTIRLLDASWAANVILQLTTQAACSAWAEGPWRLTSNTAQTREGWDCGHPRSTGTPGSIWCQIPALLALTSLGKYVELHHLWKSSEADVDGFTA